jgi:hypothetical protein
MRNKKRLMRLVRDGGGSALHGCGGGGRGGLELLPAIFENL